MKICNRRRIEVWNRVGTNRQNGLYSRRESEPIMAMTCATVTTPTRLERAPTRGAVLAVCAIVLCAAPGPVLGQELPPADELVDRFVTAIGGADAHLAPTSIRTTGRVTVASMGVQGEFELLQYAPDLIKNRVDIPAIGEIAEGYDGTTGWSTSAITGARLLEGVELAHRRERASFLAGIRHRSIVPERETVDLSEIDGEACWRVRLVWASGRETFDCYSVESGLLIATEETQISAMGEVPVTTRILEYGTFHGIRVPTRVAQTSLGQTQEILVEAVEIDTISREDLDPPPSIATLSAAPSTR